MTDNELYYIVEQTKAGLLNKVQLQEAVENASEELCRLDQKINNIESEIAELSESEDREGYESDDVKEMEELNRQDEYLRSKYDTFQDKIEYLKSGLVDSKYFNKRICFNNIRYLLKDSDDVKIGQIEKEAGVSLGYMSRLEKDDNSSDPSVEFITTAARMLSVSLDELIDGKMMNMTPTERYISNLLEKLNKDTINGELEWERDSADRLNCMESNGDYRHPLFDLRTYLEDSVEGQEEVTRVLFESHYFGCNTYINDDCFYLKMKGDSKLYLMDIVKGVYHSGDSDAFAKEIWVNTPGAGNQFLAGNKGNNDVANKVEMLFDAVRKAYEHPKIKKDIKSVLDAYIDDDDLGGNDNDDLDFDFDEITF